MNPGDRLTLNIPKDCIPGDEEIRSLLSKNDGKGAIVLDHGSIELDTGGEWIFSGHVLDWFTKESYNLNV